MASFAEFVISLFEKLGVFYIFSIIFVAVLFYFLTYLMLSMVSKQGDKPILSDNTIKVISIIIAVSASVLFGYEYNLSILIRYFVSFVVLFAILIFFLFVILIFILGSKPSISGTWPRNFAILSIAFLVTFIFVSFYIAYKDSIVSDNLGEAGPESIMKAEILIIPFLFLFMGLVASILGMEEKSSSEK